MLSWQLTVTRNHQRAAGSHSPALPGNLPQLGIQQIHSSPPLSERLRAAKRAKTAAFALVSQQLKFRSA
jgi:hypothetical protein